MYLHREKISSMSNFTIYQLQGIEKITGYADHLTHTGKNVQELTVHQQNFINTFCEHDLADTDYTIQGNSLDMNFTKSLSVKDILKMLTYIIWTDKIVDGFFLARTKDDTVSRLLHSIKQQIAVPLLN
jgi:hypothetical protein